MQAIRVWTFARTAFQHDQVFLVPGMAQWSPMFPKAVLAFLIRPHWVEQPPSDSYSVCGCSLEPVVIYMESTNENLYCWVHRVPIAKRAPAPPGQAVPTGSFLTQYVEWRDGQMFGWQLDDNLVKCDTCVLRVFQFWSFTGWRWGKENCRPKDICKVKAGKTRLLSLRELFCLLKHELGCKSRRDTQLSSLTFL